MCLYCKLSLAHYLPCEIYVPTVTISDYAYPFFKTGELWGRAILWVKNYKELLHKSWIKIIWREKLSGRMSMTQWVNGCLACLYKWWMMCVCLSVYDIHSHQTSQFHEIFALGLFWTNLGHEKARFSKFWFLRGLPIGSSVKFGPFSDFRYFAVISAIWRLGTMKFGQSASFYNPSVMKKRIFEILIFKGGAAHFG